MQVEFGGVTFTKTKFSALDGQTKVSFVSSDESLRAVCSKEKVTFEIHRDCETHADFRLLVHTFGQLLDASYREHSSMLRAATKHLSSLNPAEQ